MLQRRLLSTPVAQNNLCCYICHIANQPEDDMTAKKVVEKVLKHFGGSKQQAATQIGQGRLLRQNIERWEKSGKVPLKFCPRVSMLTGIPKQDLNSEMDWELAKETL
jgi:hypothetical protein